MGALFKKPKIEKPTPPITRDEVMLQMQEEQRLMRRRGRASNMLSGGFSKAPSQKLGSNAPAPVMGAATRSFSAPRVASGMGGYA